MPEKQTCARKKRFCKRCALASFVGKTRGSVCTRRHCANYKKRTHVKDSERDVPPRMGNKPINFARLAPARKSVGCFRWIRVVVVQQFERNHGPINTEQRFNRFLYQLFGCYCASKWHEVKKKHSQCGAGRELLQLGWAGGQVCGAVVGIVSHTDNYISGVIIFQARENLLKLISLKKTC